MQAVRCLTGVVCGVWCVVCSVWCVVCGVWCVACGMWCVVCGAWCVVRGVWCVVCGVWLVSCEWWEACFSEMSLSFSNLCTACCNVNSTSTLANDHNTSTKLSAVSTSPPPGLDSFEAAFAAALNANIREPAACAVDVAERRIEVPTVAADLLERKKLASCT